MKSNRIWINAWLNSKKTQTVKWNKEANPGYEERSHERNTLKIPYSNFGMKSLMDQLKTSMKDSAMEWIKRRVLTELEEKVDKLECYRNDKEKIGHYKQKTWDLRDNNKRLSHWPKEGG